MRLFLLSILSLGLAISASAQKVYYIYLQTDNGSAFYARLSDKIYSSSTAGYLTIPNLVDSTYTISLGFPSQAGESRFKVSVNSKDRGFLIKKMDDGFGLQDMETSSVIRQEADPTKDVVYERRSDAFTSLLSKAANDSTLLLVPVRSNLDVAKDKPKAKASDSSADLKTNPEEVKTKPEDLAAKTDSPVAGLPAPGSTPNKDSVNNKPVTSISIPADTSALTADHTKSGVSDTNATASAPKKEVKDTVEVKKPETVEVASVEKKDKVQETPKESPDSTVTAAPVAEYKRSQVTKHSESSTSEGFGLVFYDKQSEGTDTIRLIIPNQKIELVQTNQEVQKEKDTIPTNVPKDTVAKKDTTQQTSDTQANPTASVVPHRVPCTAMANDRDFFKLRKNMAARPTDELMIDEAKRAFRSRCFSTEQIKNLSTLFLTSAGKYQFFDAAYSHVADQDQFASLQSEIKDEYYLKRFKALIGE